jgi:hopanoid biosynthesis associated protein HpnK
MVAAPAAEDAIRRARRLPGLAVGLHLVLVEGQASAPATEIGPIVDARGWMGSDQVARGFRYTFSPAARRALAREIAAQFAAFARTGLPLSHLDAHKHMHLHPGVARLALAIGRDFGLRAVRVPAEPPGLIAALEGRKPALGARLLYRWSGVLRRMVRQAGLISADQIFGIGWSGQFTLSRLLALIPRLPPGVSEIYFHPAAARDEPLIRLMPDYAHEAEYAALLAPEAREALAAAGIGLTSYAALAVRG